MPHRHISSWVRGMGMEVRNSHFLPSVLVLMLKLRYGRADENVSVRVFSLDA